MFDLQHPSELEISKSQALRSHVYGGFGRKTVDKKANSILAKVIEFYKLEVDVIIQILLPKCCYIDEIDLINIISGSRMHCMPLKNNNNFFQRDVPIQIDDDVYIDKHVEPKIVEEAMSSHICKKWSMICKKNLIL